MEVLRAPVVLDARRRGIVRTEPVVLPAQAAAVTLLLTFSTSAAPIAWDADSALRAALIVTIDGEARRLSSDSDIHGGTRKHPLSGEEYSTYRLSWKLPCGWFGERSGFPKRLGETAKSTYTVHAELGWVRGSIETEVALLVEEAEAPRIPFAESSRLRDEF